MLIERWPFVKGTRFIGSGSAITTTMRDCSPDQFRAITYPIIPFLLNPNNLDSRRKWSPCTST